MSGESLITLYGVSSTVEPSVEYAWLSSIVDKSTYVWGGFSFLGACTVLWCLLVLFFIICRPMKKITNRLIANNVETLAMIATPVVVSLFFKKKTPQVWFQIYKCMYKVYKSKLLKRFYFCFYTYYLFQSQVNWVQLSKMITLVCK